jgi:hypothetical protein
MAPWSYEVTDVGLDGPWPGRSEVVLSGMPVDDALGYANLLVAPVARPSRVT